MKYFHNISRRADGAMRVGARLAAFLAVLVIFAGTSLRATNWYVDNSLSGGSNNGSSWASAWTSLGAVKWSSVSPGDTVYISGGSSSQVYNELLNSSSVTGTAAKPITISVGQEAGHNGQVIIDGATDGANQSAAVWIGAYTQLTGNAGGQTNFIVRNVTNSSNNQLGQGIYAGNAVGVAINYVQVHTCNCGISLSSGTGIVISNCYLYDIQGDHGIQLYESTGGYDASIIHDCTVEGNLVSLNGSPYGPWCIAGWDGVSVYNCNIYAGVGTVVGAKHEDGVVFYGNYLKIYNNTITDMGNAACEGGCTATIVGHYMIYNNVMQLVSATPNVQRGVEWEPDSSCTELTDVHICNNTFVNLPYYGINWVWVCSDCVNYYPTPTVDNFFVYNNIFYNSLAGFVAANANITASDFVFDYNAAWAGASGSTNFSDCGTTPPQPHLQIGNVQFVTYNGYSSLNNFHLQSTDTVARNHGTNLSSLFTTDKDGYTRPASGAWDAGAYQYHTTVTSTNPVITVTPASWNFGTIASGASATNTFTVQNTGGGTLAGSASVASPYSILSGANYSLTNGQSQVVTVKYSPTVAGTNNQSVTFTGGGGATVSVTGSATAPLSGLTFAATSGTITAPFVVTNGAVYQPIQTGVTNGGTATYAFTITNAGNYVVQAVVNAPGDAENSFYVNIDAMPTDPYMVWQIPVTTNYQSLVVSWQGNGTFDDSEFVPEIFNLTAGTHQLIFVGREMDTYLQQISILKIPSPPTGLHIVPGS